MILGQFHAVHFGKIAKLRTDLTAHEALTNPHSATAAATASRLMIRDASGRCAVATPSAVGDIATKGYVDTAIASSGAGTVTSVSAGTGLTGGPITTTGALSLANTAVTPGTYTLMTATVDAQGRITAASNGVPPILSVAGSGAINANTVAGAVTVSIVAATTGVPGTMSASDKSKLDGIASGAQVNQTTTVFGRSGAVVAVSGDYNIQKISGVTVSTVAPSGGADGDIWIQVP